MAQNKIFGMGKSMSGCSMQAIETRLKCKIDLYSYLSLQSKYQNLIILIQFYKSKSMASVEKILQAKLFARNNSNKEEKSIIKNVKQLR